MERRFSLVRLQKAGEAGTPANHTFRPMWSFIEERRGHVMNSLTFMALLILMMHAIKPPRWTEN